MNISRIFRLSFIFVLMLFFVIVSQYYVNYKKDLIQLNNELKIAIFVKDDVEKTQEEIFDALKEAYLRAGTQSALASMAGVSQGRIADYLNGRCSVGNMTVSTLLRLFPEMVIDFFGGKSSNETDNALRDQLLEIFNSLDERGKIRMVAMAAANFGEKLREETK